jgi:hypothetical protein
MTIKKILICFFLSLSFYSKGAKTIEPRDSIPEKNKSIFYLGVVSSYGYLKVKPPKPDPTRIQYHKNFSTKTCVSIIGIQARLIKSIKKIYFGGSINCDFLHFSKFSEVHDTDSIQNDFRSNNDYSFNGLMITPSLYSAFNFKFKRLGLCPYIQPGIIFDGYFINRNRYSSFSRYSEDGMILSGGLFNLSFKCTSGLDLILKRFSVGLNCTYYYLQRNSSIARLNMKALGLHLGYKF